MKKGYTLSEVLVVLLVLGIIAAFIIPAVMRTAPERNTLLYKKSFYALQEASSKLINDPAKYPEGVARAGAAGAAGNIQGLYSDYNAQTFCEDLAETMNIIGDFSCNSGGANGLPNFTTTNGVKWWNVGGGSFAAGDAGVGLHKDIHVECSGTEYKIRIFADGRVGTDASWEAENNILKQPFKFRDL